MELKVELAYGQTRLTKQAASKNGFGLYSMFRHSAEAALTLDLPIRLAVQIAVQIRLSLTHPRGQYLNSKRQDESSGRHAA